MLKCNILFQDTNKSLKKIKYQNPNYSRDRAVMLDNGYCQIVGRIKDMLIRGGENIYPREIEEVLHTHPEIIEAQVDLHFKSDLDRSNRSINNESRSKIIIF